MKNYFAFYFALMLAILFLITSCSKDDHIVPDPVDNTGKVKLQGQILGKWVIESTSGRTTAANAFLEFLSDSTCIIYNVADTLVMGEFQATSSTEISVEKFGSLSEISFANDKINFKLTYSGRSVIITAGKSNVVESGSKTELLTKNWFLTTEIDGSQLINETTGIDQLTILFTASGTYLVQFFMKGKLVESGMNNWKWDSFNPNRFVYWEEGEEIKDGNYGIIHELTLARLKITDNADGSPLTFILTPVK